MNSFHWKIGVRYPDFAWIPDRNMGNDGLVVGSFLNFCFRRAQLINHFVVKGVCTTPLSVRPAHENDGADDQACREENSRRQNFVAEKVAQEDRDEGI